MELPLVGPSRRTLVMVGALTGVCGVALGALVAYRSTRPIETIPVTPVGLLGEPAAVVPVLEPDAGRGASPGLSPVPGPGSTARPDPLPTASPAAVNAADAAVAAGGTLPTDETGVVERGPRINRGGYTLGEETDATGTMDPQVFRFVYSNYRAQIAACHSSASRTRTVTGVIVLRVRIGVDGRVASTRVISDTARVPQLTQCVQTSVRAWRYPQPEGGEVEVDYPLRFGSGS